MFYSNPWDCPPEQKEDPVEMDIQHLYKSADQIHASANLKELFQLEKTKIMRHV